MNYSIMEEEDYKDYKIIPKFPSYAINKEGTVINVTTTKKMKKLLNKGSSDNWIVQLYNGKDKGPKRLLVRRLVASVFYPFSYDDKRFMCFAKSSDKDDLSYDSVKVVKLK